MDLKDEQSLKMLQSYKIVKSNDLIQKSRFQLSLQEQKIILYLISKIRPEDMELKEHNFEIIEFCNVCGLDKDNGANYKYIKQTVKTLADKSVWITFDDRSETLIRWINGATIEKHSGIIKISLHEKLKPYLLQLQQRFTQYELLYTLAMKSQYSIRLYEILKSYEYKHRKVFSVDELKRSLSAETYDRYPDFKRKVIDISMREINQFSDLNVSYEAEKKGNKVTSLEFIIKEKKDMNERLETWARIDEVINPAQLSFFDRLNGEEKNENYKADR